jgi:hypothetical protein
MKHVDHQSGEQVALLATQVLAGDNKRSKLFFFFCHNLHTSDLIANLGSKG